MEYYFTKDFKLGYEKSVIITQINENNLFYVKLDKNNFNHLFSKILKNDKSFNIFENIINFTTCEKDDKLHDFKQNKITINSNKELVNFLNTINSLLFDSPKIITEKYKCKFSNECLIFYDKNGKIIVKYNIELIMGDTYYSDCGILHENIFKISKNMHLGKTTLKFRIGGYDSLHVNFDIKTNYYSFISGNYTEHCFLKSKCLLDSLDDISCFISDIL